MQISDQKLPMLAALKAIQRQGPISRSELTSLTGLSGATITRFTADLLARKLVVEKKETERQRRRPRTHLSINANGPVVAGASLEGNGKISITFVDLTGKRRYDATTTAGPSANLEELAHTIAIALKQLIDDAPFAREDIARVGLALPAIVDNINGIVHFVTTFQPQPVPFTAIISRHLDLPVTIENQGACIARAEHWFGNAQHLESFTLIHVAFTIESGEYVRGLPRIGAHGINSEIAHVKAAPRPVPAKCYCGGRDCLATYSSMYGILDRAGILSGMTFPPVDALPEQFDQFMKRVDAGDAQALALVEEAAIQLGTAVANHINTADPGVVLLSFANERYMRRIEARVREVIRASTVPGLNALTEIEFVLANEEWRWHGTAALAMERTFLGDPFSG